METFGRYRLLRKLGQGGMAEVFLAELEQDGVSKLLAIKRLLPAFNVRQDVVERLASEARLTVWLTHPNIVQVLDFGRVEEIHYIAMEYVDGCDLRSLIRRNRQSGQGVQLPIEVALEIAFRILDALRYAHDCTDGSGRALEIIHRDVSPHNILVGRDGHPRLADFGIARAASLFRSQQTQPGTLLGKLGYMAPEQASGGLYDARVDLFATGATLYEMLTGTRSFTDRAAQLASGLAVLPPPPSSLRSSIPASLDGLVLRALAPRPDDRFRTAAEMGAAVLEELVGFGGSPKPHQLQQLVEETLQPSRLPITALQPRLPCDALEEVRLPPTGQFEPALVGEAGSAIETVADLRAAEPRGEPLPPQRAEELPATRQWARPGPARDRVRPVVALLALGGLVLFVAGVLTGRSCREPLHLAARAPAVARAEVTPPTRSRELVRDAAPAPVAPGSDRGLDQGAHAVIVQSPGKDAAPPTLRVRHRVRTRSKARSEEDWKRAVSGLQLAQAAYANGSYRRAIELAREVVQRIPESATGWQIIGASSCRLGRAREANLAASHLDPTRLQLLQQVCRRHGVELK